MSASYISPRAAAQIAAGKGGTKTAYSSKNIILVPSNQSNASPSGNSTLTTPTIEQTRQQPQNKSQGQVTTSTYIKGEEVPISGGVAQKLKEAGIVQTTETIDTRPNAVYVVSRPRPVGVSENGQLPKQQTTQQQQSQPISQEGSPNQSYINNQPTSLSPLQRQVASDYELASKFTTLGGALEIKENDPFLIRSTKAFGQTINVPGNIIGGGILAKSFIQTQFSKKTQGESKALAEANEEMSQYVTSGRLIKETGEYYWTHPAETIGTVVGLILLGNTGRISSLIKRGISKDYVPIERTGIKVVKENAMKPLSELSKLEGTKIDTVHATLSEKLNLKVGEELPIKAQPEQAAGLRKELTQYSFYKSTEGIRGQFIGIGEGASDSQIKFSLVEPKKTALIFRDEYITPSPKNFKTPRELLEWQNLPKQSGKTFLAVENVYKLSTEEQVTTPARLLSMGRIGSKIEAVKGPLTGKYTTYFEYYKPPGFLKGTRFGKLIGKIPKGEYDIRFVEARTKSVNPQDVELLKNLKPPKKQKVLYLREYSQSYGKTRYVTPSKLIKSVPIRSMSKSLSKSKPKSISSSLTRPTSSGASIIKSSSSLSSSLKTPRYPKPKYPSPPRSPYYKPPSYPPRYNPPYSPPRSPPKYPPKYPPYSPPYSPKRFKIKGSSSGKSLFKPEKFSQKTRYTPSVAAISLGIRSKRSKVKKQRYFTGFEVRPI